MLLHVPPQINYIIVAHEPALVDHWLVVGDYKL